MNPTHEKVLKLFNLWQGAVGGEKEQARKVLVNLLQQHGLTLRDVNPELPPVRDPNDILHWKESNISLHPDASIASFAQDLSTIKPANINPKPTSTWRRFLPPVLAFVLVAALGAALLRPKSGGDAGDPLLGKPAPTFTLATLDGGKLSSAQLGGQPLVLNFWASWCVPCRDEAPLLRELSEKRSGKLRVVGVLFDDKDRTRMRKFIADYGLSYPNLLDTTLQTSIDYGIGGVPETIYIGADGLVKAVDRGELTRERLSAGLKTIGVEF